MQGCNLAVRVAFTRAGEVAMPDSVQPDWRKIAAEKFPGYTIHGNGQLCVADWLTMKVHLFSDLLSANASGRKVFELKQPEITHRRFKKIRYGRDDD